MNRKAPHVAVGNTGNERACLGKPLEMKERLPHFSGESMRYLTTSFAVPGGGLAQLAACALA